MAGAFTIEDIRLLEKTINIRERLIDSITSKPELPSAAKDVEAFTNLLESVDRSIFNKVKINIEDASAKVNEETRGILRDLIKSLHSSPQPSATTDGEPEIPKFSSTGVSVSEGELIKKTDNQDISGYLENAW